MKFAIRLSSMLWLLLIGLMALPNALSAQEPQVVSCSSNDMRIHYCDVGPTRQVTMVRKRSDAACVQGKSWGVRGNQIWVDRGCRADFQIIPAVSRRGGDWDRDRDGRDGRDRDGDRDRRDGWGQNPGRASQVISCSSDDMRRHYCNVGSDVRVRLVKQRSGSPCVQDSTWGIQGDRLWVDRGCRADFEVSSGGRPDSGRRGDDHSSVQLVSCSSNDMGRETCDIGRHREVRMVRQRSEARCVHGSTWGTSGHQIWVDRGCRADFEVRY